MIKQTWIEWAANTVRLVEREEKNVCGMEKMKYTTFYLHQLWLE